MSIFSSKTKMKKLTSRDGFDIYELGDIFYLFYPKEKTDRVIISAHGGHALVSGTNTFRVPTDTVLRFYSSDENSVLDPGFSSFYASEAAPKEVLSDGDKSFDYILSKYQGRHGNKSETYDSIATALSSAVNGRKNTLKLAEKNKGAARDKLLNSAARYKVAAVLTVRNRWLKGEATLSKVIREVKATAPEIVIFDCLFCRSKMFGGGDDAVPLIGRM